MTHVPGGSNTRNNLLAYKYTGKKSTDFRPPRGLEDGSQRWNWRHVRLVVCTKLCSFVLQTLRSSVRSFYELYDALFACSTTWTFVLYVWASTERGYDQYDQHKYDCSSNWRLKHPCSSNGLLWLKLTPTYLTCNEDRTSREMFWICANIRQHLIFVHIVGEIWLMLCVTHAYQEDVGVKPRLARKTS